MWSCTVMYFMTKVRLEHRKCWKLVNMQIITFRSHHSTIHSTDLQQHTTLLILLFRYHIHNKINY